jgi:hypothetical protein
LRCELASLETMVRCAPKLALTLVEVRACEPRNHGEVRAEAGPHVG